ncbi:MAG: hypothetical protein IIA50_01150 [Bacteroidetes bacterium]|nr:hypothetical protein [Bacteroidota bacterium]
MAESSRTLTANIRLGRSSVESPVRLHGAAGLGISVLMPGRARFMRLLVAASLGISVLMPGRSSSAQEWNGSGLGLYARLRGSDIQAAGLDRPGSALGLAILFQSVSIDGYTQRFSPLGLTPLDAAGPIVILDGQPQFFEVYGRQQFNLLPFSVADIEELLIESTPAAEAGYWSGAGRIIVRTRRPQGLSVRGIVSFANEIEDPGPFRYTARATPNIDRDGPRADIRLSYGAAPWFVQASYRSDEYHATGDRLTPRVWTTYDGDDKPRLTLEAPEALVAFRSENAEHTFRAGTISFRDFLFLDVIGRETPYEQRWKYFAASGRIRLGSSVSARYLVDRRRVDVLERPSKIAFGPNLTEDRTTATLSLELTRPGWSLIGSGGYSRREIKQPGIPIPIKIETARGSLESEWRHGPGFRQRLKLLVTAPVTRRPEINELGYAALWSLDWFAHDESGVHIAASASEQHPYEGIDLPDLLKLGLRLPLPDVHTILLPTELNRRRTVHVELGARYALSNSLTAGVIGAARLYDGLTVPTYKRDYVPWSATFDAVTEYRTGVTGRVVTLGLEIRYRAGSKFDQSFAYYWTRPVSLGNRTFQETWSPLAGHRAVFTSIWRPVDRFRVFARVTYISSRTWETYSAVPSHRRPDYILADVTFQKDLWYDHLTLSVSGVNIANAPYRPHPASETDHLALRVSIRSRFSASEIDR